MYFTITPNHRKLKKPALLGMLDVRTRFLLLPLALINIMLLQPGQVIHALVVIILILFMALVSGQDILRLIKRIAIFYPMVFLFTFPLLFSTTTLNPDESQSIRQFAHFEIHTSGLQIFIIVQIKYILSLIVLFSITACTRSRDMILALEFFRVADWILAILHYISQLLRVLSLEFQRIRIAYQSRAIGSGFLLKIKAIAGLVYVLTVRIVERSERIFLAMLSRGFKGKFYLNGHLLWHFRDTVVLCISLIITIFPLIFRGEI